MPSDENTAMGAKDFKSAVEMILGCRAYEQTEHYVPPTEKKPRGDLILPPKAKNYNRTIAYLTGARGIDKEIVYAMSLPRIRPRGGRAWEWLCRLFCRHQESSNPWEPELSCR